jgi:hypothetical protein
MPEACHSALAQLIGPEMEPISVIQRVEEHRAYWRPQSTRVVLLAESHVYTSSVEIQRTLKPLQNLPPNLPRGFTRFVYCLGYGENDLLDTPINDPPNSGTPQFWKIFHSCVNPLTQNGDFAGILVSGTRNEEERILNKLRLLGELRARGVWLVDASIAALYRPGGIANPPLALRKAVLQTSWDMYTKRVVSDAAPEAILCIGKGIAMVLRERLDRIGIPWATVPQPNARGVSTEVQWQIFATCHSVCEDPQLIRFVAPFVLEHRRRQR